MAQGKIHVENIRDLAELVAELTNQGVVFEVVPGPGTYKWMVEITGA